MRCKMLELVRKECLRRNYSRRTISSYCYCLDRFFRFCSKDPKQVTKKDVQDFLDSLVEKDRSASTINLHLNALKFLFGEIYHKRLVVRIRHAKKPKKLPSVLKQEETMRLIDAIENPRHKLMIQLLYSSGMRLSELINLKVHDLEFSKEHGWVRSGKGNKDRQFIIAEKIRSFLEDYIHENNLRYFLFPGLQGHISHRTVQVIVKKAAKKAGIKKNVHPHTLRHSFATHLIENGFYMEDVQRALGHASIKTTNVYCHVAANHLTIRSPLDCL